MKARLLQHLVCPVSGDKLTVEITKKDGDEILEGVLVSPLGHKYPIRGGIPRFVSAETYTSAFGFEWNTHSRIYLDDKDRFRVQSTQAQLGRKLALSPAKANGA